MRIRPLDLPGLLIVEPTRHVDSRGFFSETYRHDLLAAAVGDILFVQDNHSRSEKRGTVRGLHYQAPPRAQAKLVRVVRGAILDVAVDIRIGSPTFGRSVAVELSDENWQQLYIPVGFLHGFCTLTDGVDVLYKTSDTYSAAHDHAIAWNDPDLAVAWPGFVAPELLSAKDRAAPRLRDVGSPFNFERGLQPERPA